MDNQFIRFRIVVQVNGKRHVLLKTSFDKGYDNYEIVFGPTQIGAFGKTIADILKKEGIDCCPVVIREGETDGAGKGTGSGAGN